MNDNQRAAEEFFGWLNRLQAVSHLAERLKNLGDLEQNESELRRLVEEHEKKLKEAREALEWTKADNEKQGKKEKLKREELLKLALTEVDVIRAKAKAEVEAILKDGSVKLREVEDQIATRSAYLTDLNKDIAVREFKIKSLKDEMSELAKKLG